MMYLERLLQINMATLAALGALLLGMGERDETPPLLIVFAAALSIWLTDITGRFCLGRKMGNVLMLVAAGVSLRNLFPLGSELQTIGFAWLLVYLQIILLFQRKDDRTYWLLIVLSLLQVVVATLFSQGVGFGLLLVVYMLLGFSAMTLLMMHRQSQRHRTTSERARLAQASRRETPLLGESRRWPLTGRASEFTSLPGGSGRAGIGGDLFRRLGYMGLHTVVFSLALFFAIPRFGDIAWQGRMAEPHALVGFTDEVALGEIGQVIESREKVMRVWFQRESDNATLRIEGDVYLRGAVLMDYEWGQWRVGKPGNRLGIVPLAADRPYPAAGVVRQRIVMESMDRGELFYVAPYLPMKASNPNIYVDRLQQRLRRPSNLRQQQFEYTLGTTAIVEGRQLPLVPASRNDALRNALAMPRRQPSESLPHLVRIARQWIAESGLPEEDLYGRARYLTQKLAANPEFRYSLIGQDRDPEFDPIEDFLTKHRQGHCEYFATALTLMLRSQGIPARLVSGYKCDEWQAPGQYFQVRQLHAHTWVEAHLPRQQIPDELLHGKDCWPWSEAGGWLQLDPTPTASAREASSWFTPALKTVGWLDAFWSSYVVELDYQRQRNAIYEPIAQAVRALWRETTGPARWKAILDAVAAALYLNHLGREAQWILLGLTGCVAAALLAGFVRLLWPMRRGIFRRWRVDASLQDRGRRAEVDFYRRFENLAARQGLVRPPTQTQREFADSAGSRLAEWFSDQELASLPAVIVEAFYRVRFGREPLDNLQVQAVEHALAQLAVCRQPRPAKTQEGRKNP